MSTPNTEAIVRMHEIDNLSAEEIYQGFDGLYELETIKYILLQHSRQFNDSLKGDDKLFDKSDMIDARDTYKALRFSDDDKVREKVCRYIMDEAKGRHDNPLSGIKSITLNINTFNEQLRRARAAKDRKQPKVIDVSSSEEHTVEPVPV